MLGFGVRVLPQRHTATVRAEEIEHGGTASENMGAKRAVDPENVTP